MPPPEVHGSLIPEHPPSEHAGKKVEFQATDPKFLDPCQYRLDELIVLPDETSLGCSPPQLASAPTLLTSPPHLPDDHVS